MQTVKRQKNSGGRPQKFDEIQKDAIVNHYNHGTTQKALAEEFNTSITTIRKILKERGA